MNLDRIPVDTHYDALERYGVPTGERQRIEDSPPGDAVGRAIEELREDFPAGRLPRSHRVSRGESAEVLRWHGRSSASEV